MKFGVVSAEGLISGLKSDAKISTISGDLTIDGVVGDLELNAVSGEISVRNHTGRISAHTISGDVMATGTLHKFSADSVSGNLFLDIAGVPDEINTNSVSGDLTVRLDEGVGARYRINSVSGKLQLDDTIIRGMTGRNFTHQSGSLDGTWVEVSSNSVSGNISVVRRPSTDATGSATDATNGSEASA